MSDRRQNLHKKFLDGIRVFNKYIFNRFTLMLARSGKGPFSIVHHIGRRSGQEYRTPVLASYVDKIIIIPLSYGENVDWLRNVLAQGGCDIVRKNERIVATNPEVVDSVVILADLPEERRELFQRFKMEKFLRLQVVSKE
jgi:deazaflavin-dependent oxidoreductase (nitroreductase family)